MKLIQLISGRKTQNQTLREASIAREDWATTRVYATLPYSKDSDIVLRPYKGEYQPAPEGYSEFADVKDINEWMESFDDGADPGQELIDYVAGLSEGLD